MRKIFNTEERVSIKAQFLSLKTRKDVADLLGISERSLRYFLFKVRPENMYKSFTIPKSDGSKRSISAPDNRLKAIQRKLADILSVVYDPKVCAYGFIPGKNFVDNAACHIGRKLILNIDLQDFFSQIHFGRISGMLCKEPYNIGKEAAITIAQIACLNGRLPQGAPSSPIITNMITAPLDNAMMRLAKKYSCVYTRYADDITFSTYKPEYDRSIVYIDKESPQIGVELGRILEKHSFVVNHKKIRLYSQSNHQEVTGLTVNKFPNLPRPYLKHLRAIIHSCNKFGVYNAARFYLEKGLCKNPVINKLLNSPDSEGKIVEWFKLVLVGKVRFIKQVKGCKNLTYLSFAKQVNNLFDEPIFDLSELDLFENIIKSSVFILEETIGVNPNQGSAFYLSDVGLITCYHVTENGGFYKVFSVDTYNDNRYLGVIGKELNEISSDKTIDYAIYKPQFSIKSDLTFSIGDSKKIKRGDQVTIIGYPNHQKGNSPYIQPCVITSQKEYLGAPLFTVSGRIGHGASGGIVLNSNNEAIGIIKGGIVTFTEDETNENQGFIPLYLALENQHK